jgi:hypothetical protein
MVLAVGKPNVEESGTEDTDHHWLDHAEREQRGDRGVDGVPTGEQHLGTGRRSQWMIGNDNAA